MLSGTMLSLEGTHALGADFLLNFRMAILRVGGEGGGEPDLRQPTPCQSITCELGVCSREGGGGWGLMIRCKTGDGMPDFKTIVNIAVFAYQASKSL